MRSNLHHEPDFSLITGAAASMLRQRSAKYSSFTTEKLAEFCDRVYKYRGIFILDSGKVHLQHIIMANKLIAEFFFVLLAGTVLGRCAPRTINISYRAAKAETIQVFGMCGAYTCGGPVLTFKSAACTRILCRGGARCNTCRITIKASELRIFHTGEPAIVCMPLDRALYYAHHGHIGEDVGRFPVHSDRIHTQHDIREDGVKSTEEPDIFHTRPKQLGQYGVKFAGQSMPFLTFYSDWSLGQASWFAKNGFVPGCKPRVACRTRAGLSSHPRMPFDVAVTAAACYTNLYSFGNAPGLSACLAGKIAHGVPTGEIYGKNCPARPLSMLM